MKIRRFLVIALGAFVVAFGLTFAFRRFAVFGSLAGHTIAAATPKIPALIRALRPNYPYSVIRGGAYSPSELNYANQSDPVVRAHYADFYLKSARIVQLTDDRFQYASYRIKDQIYWTHKKLRIRKGEYLLTDGVAFARARCGNRLSEKPQLPVSQQEPEAALLSMPPIQPEMLPNLEMAQAPPLGELAEASPRLAPVLPNTTEAIPVTVPAPLPELPVGPVAPAVPPVSRHQPPPTFTPPPINSPIPPVLPVPEPSTVYLFIVFFIVSVGVAMRIVPE